jgi:hypothetical protein
MKKKKDNDINVKDKNNIHANSTCMDIASYANCIGQSSSAVYAKVSKSSVSCFRLTRKKIFIFVENDRPSILGLHTYLSNKYGLVMTVKELSGEFHASESLFRKVAKKGYLLGKKDFFGQWQFTVDDVINYIYGVSFDI